MADTYEGVSLQDVEAHETWKYQYRQTLPTNPILMMKFLFTFLVAFGIGYVWHGIMSRQVLFPKDSYVHEAAVPPTTTPILFEEQPLFVGPPTHISDLAWEDLIPLGRGFIEISDFGSSTRYCVSAFHQLHCLDMLRHGYFAAISNAKSDLEAGSLTTPSPHMKHCFDYLRQALMCAADPTLEIRNESVHGVTGWGTSHQCRDFKALKRWTEEHRYNNEGGIQN
ncbi:hypothetical protein F4860DRAFT_457869 [Xylaria cubensis]|nr:hypothetical protein F4860DRAFT_457869 [Xylaria cubensis]